MYLNDVNAGAVVAQLRELRGLTQAGLSKQIHMTQGFLSQIESGKRIPSLPALVRVLDGLDAELVIQLREDAETSVPTGHSRSPT